MLLDGRWKAIRNKRRDAAIEAVASVLRGDWLTQGPTIDRFEEAFGIVRRLLD